MPPRRRAATSVNASRLKVLAAGEEGPFRDAIAEMLDSGDRLTREAALDALLERPLAGLRERLRALYAEADGAGEKLDPGAHIRERIAQLLLRYEDARDGDIGLRASDTYETSMGVDSTANLRALGLKIVAMADPELFPYVAAEHVNDAPDWSPEPANTALQLLAATGHEVSVYQWLVGGEHDPALIEAAVGLLADAPAAVLSRCMAQLARGALARNDEALLTKLAETIVERELEDAYGQLVAIVHGGISAELYAYLALLLAGTNRPALLAILDGEMADVLRRPAIVAALRVRTTPEQEAILKRWDVS
jgi:hypothetical protein